MENLKTKPAICESCGETLSYGHVPMEVVYGADKSQVVVVAEVPAWTCNSCGDVITAEGAELAEHNAICEYLGRFKPDEIRAIRDEMGLTQNAMAVRMRVGRVTLTRWETGVQIQSAGHNESIAGLISDFRQRKATANSSVFRTDVSHRFDAALAFDLWAA